MKERNAVSMALEMLNSIYTVEEDLWNFDAIDWDKLYLILEKVKTDRKSAMQLIQDYAKSASTVHRFFSAKLAGVVMNPVEFEEKNDARLLIKLLDEMSLREDSTEVLEAIASSLMYPYMIETKDTVFRLSKHENRYVRLAATISLNSLQIEGDEDVSDRLEELSSDSDPEVADWAKFGLEPIQD